MRPECRGTCTSGYREDENTVRTTSLSAQAKPLQVNCEGITMPAKATSGSAPL